MKFDKDTLLKLLDFLYDKALTENPKLKKKSPQDLAKEYQASKAPVTP